MEGDIIVSECDGGLLLRRSPLSKIYLEADVTDSDDNFVLRRQDWLTQFDIKFLELCAVIEIERVKKVVCLPGSHILSHNEPVFAQEAVASRLLLAGGSANGVHILRIANGVHGLRDCLKVGQNAVVIGGGCIGLELDVNLRKAGKDEHVLELAPRLLARISSSALSNYCTKPHATAGVKISLILPSV